MNANPDHSPGFDELAHRHFDGGATSGDRLELERRLLADPAAADRFAELCRLEVALEGAVAEQRKRQGVIHELGAHELAAVRRTKIRHGIFRATAAAAAVLMLGICAKLLWPRKNGEVAGNKSNPVPSAQQQSAPVAAAAAPRNGRHGTIPPVLANYFLPNVVIEAGIPLADALTDLKAALNRLNRTHLAAIAGLELTADPEAASRTVAGLNLRGIPALSALRLLAAQADCTLEAEGNVVAMKPLRKLAAADEKLQPERMAISAPFLAAAENRNTSNRLAEISDRPQIHTWQFLPPDVHLGEANSPATAERLLDLNENGIVPLDNTLTFSLDGGQLSPSPTLNFVSQRTEGDYRLLLANWGVEVESFGGIEIAGSGPLVLDPEVVKSAGGLAIESYETRFDRNGTVTFNGRDLDAAGVPHFGLPALILAENPSPVITFTPTARGRRVLAVVRQAMGQSAPQRSVTQTATILSVPKVVLGKPVAMVETEKVLSAEQFQQWLDTCRGSGADVLAAPDMCGNAGGQQASLNVGDISITSCATLEGALVKLEGKFRIAAPPTHDDFLSNTVYYRLMPEPETPIEQDFTIYLAPGQTAVLGVSGGASQMKDYHFCFRAELGRN